MAEDEVLDRLRRQLAVRLRPLCPHMRQEEFDSFVARLADLQHKYDHLHYRLNRLRPLSA